MKKILTMVLALSLLCTAAVAFGEGPGGGRGGFGGPGGGQGGMRCKCQALFYMTW